MLSLYSPESVKVGVIVIQYPVMIGGRLDSQSSRGYS
jgi:hypothetical protein